MIDRPAEERLFQRYLIGEVTKEQVFEEFEELALANSRPWWQPWWHDLMQEARIGVWIAIDKFDPSRGFRFSTYAKEWIRQRTMCWWYDNQSTVRVPVAMRKMMNRMRQGQEVEGTAPAMARARRLVDRREQSLDAGFGDSLRAEQEGEREPLDQELLEERMDEAMARLDFRERTILKERFVLELTLREIGERHGISLERARQIINSSLAKLRHPDLEAML